MEATAKSTWLKALRSGEYKQAKNVLQRQSGSMCCLGVLIDSVEDGEWDLDTNWIGERCYSFDGETTQLPEKLRRKYKITKKQQDQLVTMNDGFGVKRLSDDYQPRQNFAQIADWIEANL